MHPKRTLTRTDDGYILTVTPPAFMGLPPATINLTADQVIRLLEWRCNGGLIQDVFPELSADEREIILSGITPDGWKALSA